MKKLLTNFALLSMFVFPLAVNAKEMTSDLTLTEDLKESITVKSGNYTLNLAGFNVTNTENEDTIHVSKGATLTIKGDGTLTNTSHRKTVIFNEGTVVVDGGNYIRKNVYKTNDYYVVLNQGKMTINAGKFTIDDGISSLIANGWYDPKANTEKVFADLVINGGTFEMTNNDKYIKNDDYGIMTVNDGTFNMSSPCSAVIGAMGYASGKELVTINGGIFNYSGDNYAIWDDNGSDDGSMTVINGGVFNLTNGKISNMPIGVVNPGEDDKDVSFEFKVIGSDNQTIIAKKSELTQKVEVKDVTEKDLNKEDVDLINKLIDNKYVLAKYYNIDLFNAVKDLKVEQITDSSKEVAVTLNIPSDMEKVKDGFTRKYYIVRVHDGKTDILDTTLNADGTLTFKTDKFSTYSLVYTDTETNIDNPKTSDNIALYLVFAGVSFIGLMKFCKDYKRRNN